jgi:siroheme synthase-like protein
METHGVFLRLGGRRCVVVGGDDVATARALACAAAGADVTLVADVPCEGALEAARSGRIRLAARPYRGGDLAGAVLAYASSRDPDLIARLRADAAAAGVLLNVVDVPDACDFFAGAVVERGAVTVLVGTGGTAPAVAGVVRSRIADTVGPEYGALATVIGALRARLADRPDRTHLLRRLARSRLVDHLRDGDVGGAERLIHEITGTPCTLAALGVVPDASS